mgnify:CR=1 FL=1
MPFFLYIKGEAGINKRKEWTLVEQMIALISEVGFPIVVTLYLLYRIETKLDMVVQSIQNLPERMKAWRLNLGEILKLIEP